MANTKRYRIIVNPNSSRGACGRAIPAIRTLLEERNLTYDLVETQAAKDAIALAAQAGREGYDVVVAVGGDGIFNEVLNGLMQARAEGYTKSAIGLIPIGRGNDFAWHVGIPAELPAACDILAGAAQRTIDVGRVVGGDYPQGMWFGNGLGIGFDAVVNYHATNMKWLSGFASYAVAAFKTIFIYYTAPRVKIEYEGISTEMNPLMISIMNGRRVGGGFLMTPDAKDDDGLLDLCIAEQVSRPQILATIPLFFSGTQFKKPTIKGGQTRKISVTALEGSLPVQADGEIVCMEGKRVDIEIHPKAINLICPLVVSV